AMVFLYIPDRRSEQIALTVKDAPPRWTLVTALDYLLSEAGSARWFNLAAPSYDAFTDGPIEIGAFTLFKVPELTPPISVAVHGDNWKQPDVEATLRKICGYELQMMGGAPFEHYLFILHIGKAAQGAGGGMEHANSTAINISSGQTLSGVAAHEFFHLW